MNRRDFLDRAAVAAAVGLPAANAAAQEPTSRQPAIDPRDPFKITRLETFLVKPRWLFLKIHTDAGIVGLGEPILEGRALTCADGRRGDRALPGRQGPAPGRAPLAGDLPPRLLPRRPDPDQRAERHRPGAVGHQGQGAGRAGLRAARRPDARPRPRLRPRRHAGGDQDRPWRRASPRSRPGPAKRPAGALRRDARRRSRYAAEQFAALRKAAGDDVDIAIDFHGAISPATAKLLIKALEPYQPMFIEEPCQCQNVDVMAEIARGTHLPIATGERIFTKWGFREMLEKQAATILQPDLCHAGGITEVRLIAGMAEAYYAAIAPHNPLGPISLAAGIQLAASIPNFLCQEQVSLGEGYLKTAVRRAQRLRRPAHRPRPGHRARRERPGRQDRPRLAEPGELRRGRRLGGGLVA